MEDVFQIWVYLSSAPLLWLTLTVVAYGIGDYAFRASGRRPLVNPVLIALVILSTLLLATGTDYATYFEGAQFVHFMLGPATVALALPLYANRRHVLAAALPMAAALAAGSLTAMLSALAVGWAMGLRAEPLMSLVPKAVTSPVAIGIAEKIGGAPGLTAPLVILTGIFGAVIVTPFFNRLGVRDYRARGFATGAMCHGIGTARAFQVDPTAGAFAGIGMALNAIFTAIAAPMLVGWLF